MKSKAVRSPGKTEQVFLFPGRTSAEPWELWAATGNEKAKLGQIYQSPNDNRLKRQSSFALPIAQIFCLPLWLNETDARQFPGMIELQLELRGLQSRGSDPTIFSWSVVAKEAKRTLVIAGILPSVLPQEIEAEGYASFDVSARYLSLPEDAMTLWQEQDRLVVAVTQGSELIFCQSFQEASISLRLLQDINCLLVSLNFQQIALSLKEVVIWFEATPAEWATLQHSLPVPVRRAEKPAPKIPATLWNLTPPVVGKARRKRKTRRWQGQGLLVALALYLVVVCSLLGKLYWTSLKVDELHRWQITNASDLALVHETSAVWKDLGPVVDENVYPLELLLRCSESLPADQLHLTLFEVNDGQLLIKAEAKNVTAAFQFGGALKHNPHLVDYIWQMGEPRVLPNDLAQIQIEGTHHAPTN